MNLVADESVDAPIVDRLRQEGHDVHSIAEVSPSVSDEVVLREANDWRAVLMTADKDFGELVFRQRRVTTGVVLRRLSGVPAPAKAELVARVIREHASELPGAVSVIGPGSIRIRHQFG